MSRFRPHIIMGSLMLIFMSISVTFSTLHSHHHIQWDHPKDFANTGNCFTADTTICPICGYHLKTNLPAPDEGKASLVFHSYIHTEDSLIIPEFPVGIINGRSPPALA